MPPSRYAQNVRQNLGFGALYLRYAVRSPSSFVPGATERNLPVQMTFVDFVILALVALMALQGFARGFIVGAMALIGFIGGGLIGSRVAPLLLSGGAHSPYSALFSLGGAVILGGLLASIFEGVARRVRRFIWLPGLCIVDGMLGAILTAVIGLGMAWITGAVLLQTSSQFSLPPSVRHSIARSLILRNLNAALPPSGAILNALGRIDPLGNVTGKIADVPAPDRKIVYAGGVTGAGASVVKILGDACGFGVEGSGWVAGPGLVVTNAHVVAGEPDTTWCSCRGGAAGTGRARWSSTHTTTSPC